MTDLDDTDQHTTYEEQNDRDPHRIRCDYTDKAMVATYIVWHASRRTELRAIRHDLRATGPRQQPLLQAQITHHDQWVRRLQAVQQPNGNNPPKPKRTPQPAPDPHAEITAYANLHGLSHRQATEALRKATR